MTDEEMLRWHEQQAEEAYGEMYNAMSPTSASACYSNAKEAFCEAIKIAHRLGLSEEAVRLDARLAHIRAVFRSQFG